jgi:hypothetical protein
MCVASPVVPLHGLPHSLHSTIPDTFSAGSSTADVAAWTVGLAAWTAAVVAWIAAVGSWTADVVAWTAAIVVWIAAGTGRTTATDCFTTTGSLGLASLAALLVLTCPLKNWNKQIVCDL